MGRTGLSLAATFLASSTFGATFNVTNTNDSGARLAPSGDPRR